MGGSPKELPLLLTLGVAAVVTIVVPLFVIVDSVLMLTLGMTMLWTLAVELRMNCCDLRRLCEAGVSCREPFCKRDRE